MSSTNQEFLESERGLAKIAGSGAAGLSGAPASSGARPLRWRRALPVTGAGLLILLCGWFLRAPALDFLLPQVLNGDGLVVVRQVELYRSHAEHLESERSAGAYPLLPARIVSLWPAKVAEPGRALSLAEHLELAVSPWLEVRKFLLAISLLTIPATYFLARHFLDRAGSLFASGLLATSALHIAWSMQEKVHAAATSLILLALLAALRLRRKPDVRSYLLCGVATAVAIGTLMNGFACILPLAAAHFLREKPARKASTLWTLLWLAMIAVVVRLWYPRPADTGSQGVGRIILHFVHLLFSPDRLQLGRLPILLGRLWSSDPVLFVLAMLGILAWIAAALGDRERRLRALRGDLAVVLAFAVPFLLVVGLNEETGTRVRYALPLFPALACAAAYAFSRGPARWMSKLHGSALRTACTAAAGAVLLAAPSAMACHVAEARTRPDTLEEAAHWIERNVDPSEPIVITAYRDLPLLPTSEAIAENSKVSWRTIWSEHFAHASPDSIAGVRYPVFVLPGPRVEARQALAQDPLAYFARWGARYAVFDLGTNDPVIMKALSRIEGKAQRVARFTAFPDHGERYGVVESWAEGSPSWWPYALTMWHLERLGPTVEIWRLP